MITDQDAIYDALRELLSAYEPPYIARKGGAKDKRSIELWAEGDYEAFGKRRKEIYFGGLVKQKDYVGFYFMPVYSDPQAMQRIFSERLLKTLKGKSCFHIKQLDDELVTDIKHALAEGFKVYEARGWV